MVGVIFMYVDTVYGLYGYSFFMLSWMFQNDYLDTGCFECLVCMGFVFLYLHLFSAIEHFSHGKELTIIIIIIIIILLSQNRTEVGNLKSFNRTLTLSLRMATARVSPP